MNGLTPYITQDKVPGDLQDLIIEIYSRDHALNDCIPDALREPLKCLLRIVNGYYSNKIEGNLALPSEILQLQEGKAAQVPDADLLEIKQYLEVQRQIADGELAREKVSTCESLCAVHKALYQDFPPTRRCMRYSSTRERVEVIAGAYREHEVKVGQHTPPAHNEVAHYLRWFEQAYQPDRTHGLNRLLAAAGSHHRFTWIHPFLDGNGRVGRLFTDAYMQQSGLSGYSFWSMSRGFARDRDAYYAALKQADLIPRGDWDGRGLLSEQGLLSYTKYFLQTALEQVTYSASLFRMDHLKTRMHYYFDMRANAALLYGEGIMLPPLGVEVRKVYNLLMNNGPMTRRALCQATGMGYTAFQKLLRQMSAERLVTAVPKRPIELALSPASISIFFPKLW